MSIAKLAVIRCDGDCGTESSEAVGWTRTSTDGSRVFHKDICPVCWARMCAELGIPTDPEATSRTIT